MNKGGKSVLIENGNIECGLISKVHQDVEDRLKQGNSIILLAHTQ